VRAHLAAFRPISAEPLPMIGPVARLWTGFIATGTGTQGNKPGERH